MITEVTHESWFSRIGNAIKGVLLGIVLFFGAIALLFWNEGRAVDRAQALAEGISNVQSEVSPLEINPVNDQKLVHMVGLATTEETITDDVFAVSAPRTLKLRRRAEMFQWQENESSETRKKAGGGTETVTTYTYDQVWSDHRIDSSDFHPEGSSEYGDGNPEMSFHGATRVSEPITVGAFKLNPGLISEIDSFETLAVAQDALETLPEEERQRWATIDGGLYRASGPTADPANPRIGDIRITFQMVKPVEVSLIAQQTGDTFQAYQPQSAKSTLEMLSVGRHGSDEMFQQQQNANRNLTWILRGVGFIAMAIGIALVFNPLVVFADVIPLFGNILGAGVGIFSLVIAAVVSLVTISIAWLVFRPLLGIALILAAAGLISAAVLLCRRRSHDPLAQAGAGSQPAETL